jgi:hypothetical protein
MVNEAKGGVITKPARVTVGEHLKNWIKDVSIQTLATRTLENYEYNINKLFCIKP